MKCKGVNYISNNIKQPTFNKYKYKDKFEIV